MNIEENLKMTKKKEKVFSFGKMVINIKENSRMINKKVTVFLCAILIMEAFITDNLRMDNWMEMEFSQILMELFLKLYIKTVT